MSISCGGGTFHNQNPNASAEEISVGRMAANYFKADIVVQAPVENVAGQRTSDYRIVFKGQTMELKNVSGTAKFDQVTKTASHAQSKNVILVTKLGQLSAADCARLLGRLFGPNSPSGKQSITILEQTSGGYEVKYRDVRH